MTLELNDYELLELDYDGFYYPKMRTCVNYISTSDSETLLDFQKWFLEEEEKAEEHSLYYKGTRLYFTYENKKYYISWVFYGDYIRLAVKKLESIGAHNIVINHGSLD